MTASPAGSHMLSERHVQFIAIGGAIGAGLFVGSGAGIALAGPGILLAYLIAAIPAFIVARCVGEFVLSDAAGTTFINLLAARLGSPVAAAFGWAYWAMWLLTGMFELGAASTLITFWYPGIPPWVTILACLAGLTAINLGHVRMFGEFEFWLSLVKVLTILGIIAFGMLWLGQSYYSVDAAPAGAGSGWHVSGLLPNGIPSLFATLPAAMFSFGGVELIGLTAARTENPKVTIPRAVNSLIFRISIFYIGSLGIILAIVPWQTFTAGQSPYVEAFKALGLGNAAGLVNFVVLTAVLSACNSGLFATGQILAGLADRGAAPGWLKQRPGGGHQRQVAVSALLMLGAVVASYFVPSGLLTTLGLMIAVFVAGSWLIVLIGYGYVKWRAPRPEAPANFAVPLPIVTVPAAVIVVLLALLGLGSQESGVFALVFGLSVYGVAFAWPALATRRS